MMKRAVSIILCLLACCCAFGQQDIQAILGSAAAGRVSFTFRFNPEGKEKKVTSGKVTIQNRCFLIDMGMMKVICDGKSRWTVDKLSEEVYIEDGSKLPAIFADPAVLMSCLSDVSATDGKIKGTFSLPEKRGRYNFEFSGFSYAPASGDSSDFSLDTASLGKSWVVTDLR